MIVASKETCILEEKYKTKSELTSSVPNDGTGSFDILVDCSTMTAPGGMLTAIAINQRNRESAARTQASRFTRTRNKASTLDRMLKKSSRVEAL